MKFEDLLGKYDGATIGVIGSGKSLNEFKQEMNHRCDVVIACNGAPMALDSLRYNIDYFIYGDYRANEDIWFGESEKFRGNRGNKTLRFSPIFMLHKDPFILPDKEERNKLERSFDDFIREQGDREREIFFRPDQIPFDKLKGIMYLLDNLNLNFIKPGIGPLCRGGTITGTASMLAHKMGASVIELYGCGFDNSGNQGNYAYDAQGAYGNTTSKQRNKMNRILRRIREHDIKIICHGYTTLKIPD